LQRPVFISLHLNAKLSLSGHASFFSVRSGPIRKTIFHQSAQFVNEKYLFDSKSLNSTLFIHLQRALDRFLNAQILKSFN